MAFPTAFQIAAILIVISIYILYMKWMRSKYPPGPWPLPIIGNLHLLSRKPYIELTNLGKRYGSVFTIWMGWQPTVVVSELHLIEEATIQKGFDFAGRSMNNACYRVITNGNKDLSSRSYDEKVPRLRKVGLSIMKTKSIGGFSIQNVVEEEIQHLVLILKGVNSRVVDPCLFIRLPITNIVMRTVLHYRFKNEKDPAFLSWRDAMKGLLSAVQKAVIISLVPALGYVVPGIQRRIQSNMQLLIDFIDNQVTFHEKTYQAGAIRDLTDLIIEYQRSQGHDTPISQKITRMNVCGFVKDMLTAGTETTVSTILWSLLVLLHRRDIQQKIQIELDEYLQKRGLAQRSSDDTEEDRSPSKLIFTLIDKPNLPYLNAFIYESLRLLFIGPLGVPHQTMKDTSIGKYSIPNDTTILFNIYACHKDEKIWKKPLDFIPERFLDRNGLLDKGKTKQLMSFGAGPRSCIGENLAKIEVFICLANVLHTFDLCCTSVDQLPVLDDGIFQLELAPYPFKMIFKIRK